MFNFLKRKKKEESNSEGGDETEDEEKPVNEKQVVSSNSDVIRLATDVDRIKATVEGFAEIRKSLTERINGMSEQIGELRAMILDRDRTIQEIELKAVKAADLVESVQPDKLMVEVQKEDAKFEALKANLEGNESIMNRIMDELKEMRKKLDFFRGIDEIINLAEETKKELVEIKKVEAKIGIETDKVDTIYGELRKKFQDIDIFSSSLQEVKVNIDQNTKDLDFVKTKMSGLADKSEVDRLVQKVQRYIQALEDLNKTSSLTKDINQLKTILDGLK
jgi:hypothetical protein